MVGAGDGSGHSPGQAPRSIAGGAAKEGWAALAVLYASADEAHRDLARAADAYQKAADLGDAWAMISLAQLVGQGNGVPADFDRALALLDKAMAVGGEMTSAAWGGIGDFTAAATARRDRRRPWRPTRRRSMGNMGR
jgi:TPR repeat protein